MRYMGVKVLAAMLGSSAPSIPGMAITPKKLKWLNPTYCGIM